MPFIERFVDSIAAIKDDLDGHYMDQSEVVERLERALDELFEVTKE